MDDGRRFGSAGIPAADAQPAARASPKAAASSHEPAFSLDDGVYRPETDASRVILTAGDEEESESRRSNGPPEDFTILEQVFPGLRNAPAAAVPLTPVGHFLSFSALSDEANLEGTLGAYWALVSEIKRIDPSFVENDLLPMGRNRRSVLAGTQRSDQ